MEFYFATRRKSRQVLRVSHPLRRLPSLVEQTAAHLREGFQGGRWVGPLPGVVPLADELMVSKDIVRAALKALEEEGWIEDGGAGRRRRILPQRNVKPKCRALRIGVMLYVPLAENDVLTAAIVLAIRNAVEVAGHVCVFSDPSLAEMKDNLSRISRCVKAADADAWIVFAASRGVLEWFAAQPFPVLAYGGRFQNLPVACSATSIATAIESVVNVLVDYGHRRIVMLMETFLRQPTLIPSLEIYLSTLEARGIAPTHYNLPHFEETVEDLETFLDGLFRLTPPTALIVHHGTYLVAVLSFLARRGLQVPRDVSLITVYSDPIFRLCEPQFDHFQMQRQDHIDRISRWVNSVAKGRPDKRQVIFDAKYVRGGTVGQAKKNAGVSSD